MELSDDILSALRMKHPSLHPESVFPSPPNLVDFCPLPSISADIIVQAVHSFPRGSSAGPDGIRPQHLLDLVSPTAEQRTPSSSANFLWGYPHPTSEKGGRSTSHCH